MRVLHIIKVKGIAGAEAHLLDLMEGMKARDIDVQCLLLMEPDDIGAKTMHKAVEAIDVPVHKQIINRHVEPLLVRHLRAKIIELQPDIVHTHLLHADLYGIPAAKLAGVPVIITSRHNDSDHRLKAPLNVVNQGLWRTVTAGIAISDAVYRFLITYEGVPEVKLHRIHYGLPLPAEELDKRVLRSALRHRIKVAEETPLIGMVCRLIKQKGITYALDAFAMLDDLPDMHFVIAGDGDLRESLQQQARDLGIAERVHWLGWVDEPLDVIAGLDLLLMPSVNEGFGMTMLEAMSQSIALVGSTASAIPEVIEHGENGLTVPPRDAPALAEAIRTLMNDAPLRKHMGMMGLDRLERLFSAERMIDETVTLYRQLLTGA